MKTSEVILVKLHIVGDSEEDDGRWSWWSCTVAEISDKEFYTDSYFSSFLWGGGLEIIIYSTPYMNGGATTLGVFKAYVVFFSWQFAIIPERFQLGYRK